MVTIARILCHKTIYFCTKKVCLPEQESMDALKGEQQ